MVSTDDRGIDDLARWTSEVLCSCYPPWPPEVRCLDLLEEAGELAHAVLLAEKHKQEHGLPAEAMSTAICGVLVDVLALADHYGVRLAAVYPALLSAHCHLEDHTAERPPDRHTPQPSFAIGDPMTGHEASNGPGLAGRSTRRRADVASRSVVFPAED